MNRQPYCKAPRDWPPKLSPFWVRITRNYRRRQLAGQRIEQVIPQNLEVVGRRIERGDGVLITPNHSAHYDGPALYFAADSIDLPLYFMTAWQVFAMSSRRECWLMQRLGCFSVDREANDRRAFQRGVDILGHAPYPLVVFPEGDIYHTSDYVTPFREGAAAIALTAAKRTSRSIVAIPCGIKFWYATDPTDELMQTIAKLEHRFYLRDDTSRSLRERLHRLAEAALALKELDYLGATRSGRLRDRAGGLLEFVLARLESQFLGSSRPGAPPSRVKQLRQHLIRELAAPGDAGRGLELAHAMEDLFFVMQLYSYRGDYLADQPSIERIAETVDKLEEDVLGQDYPTPRGRRTVVLRFGEPLEVGAAGTHRRTSAAQLTRELEQRVQSLIDELNKWSPNANPFDTMRRLNCCRRR